MAERIGKIPRGAELLPDERGYDLLVFVEGKSLREVASFVSEKLSSLGGVISTATHFPAQGVQGKRRAARGRREGGTPGGVALIKRISQSVSQWRIRVGGAWAICRGVDGDLRAPLASTRRACGQSFQAAIAAELAPMVPGGHHPPTEPYEKAEVRARSQRGGMRRFVSLENRSQQFGKRSWRSSRRR